VGSLVVCCGSRGLVGWEEVGIGVGWIDVRVCWRRRGRVCVGIVCRVDDGLVLVRIV